ncbi:MULTISPECIES: Mov34/MPN/PAD-1 family protein [unclassified Archaeoglobus]|uniref:Mov34/MPN/PAD-1 family protein n=1 Tax=unclassified Archaeoglobus TaxID=2643606 RepID=UPI0025BFB05C|nr:MULTISPECIES: Mov34/MPN/PAD-1 family protein [unclassified Archaeoglobus]
MKISKTLLLTILEAAKSAHPDEFVALLSGSKDVIEELIFLPFVSGSVSAVIHLDMLPIGMKVFGTVHSHSSPSCRPSDEDMALFTRFGKYHIIVCYPYDERSWKCYDRSGSEIELEVVEED